MAAFPSVGRPHTTGGVDVAEHLDVIGHDAIQTEIK
jgi:hypothetical protein